MNVSQEPDGSEDILCISFNQISTALCVGTKTGYSVYDLQSVYECMPTLECTYDVQDVCIIERSFSTGLVAYVMLEKPRTLILFNCYKGQIITEKMYPNTVISVKLNRHNVVVCLEDEIYVMDVKVIGDESTHVIQATATNVKGIIALTHGRDRDPSLLAYPGSLSNGDVQIFDCVKKHVKNTIPAHTSQLAALAFDEKGGKLATASIKGTVIRVFSVYSGEILFEFRRGVKRCVEIKCLSFCKEQDLLCASSNTETIHIFKLCSPDPIEPVEEEAEGWMEMFGRVLTQSAKYLPTQMSDVLTQQRAFAFVHLPFVDQKTICAITCIKNTPYVAVASLEGFLYLYDINLEIGGPCQLVKQHKLEGPRLYPKPPSQLSSPVNLYRPNGLPSLETKRPQGSTGCKCDPTACLQPEVVGSHDDDDEEDDTPELDCPEDGEVPELCVENCASESCGELPPLFHKET